jgi:hypothetical protein
MQWVAAKGTRRELEGKDTVFFHGQVRIAPTNIQGCKRRKVGAAPPPLSARELLDAKCLLIRALLTRKRSNTSQYYIPYS